MDSLRRQLSSTSLQMRYCSSGRLPRVVVVAVDDRRRIGIAGVLGIALSQTFQVFVVVVGVGAPIETDVATHNGVRERIAVALDLPVAEDEALVRLGA